jgi:hypothetical protein
MTSLEDTGQLTSTVPDVGFVLPSRSPANGIVQGGCYSSQLQPGQGSDAAIPPIGAK